jgi:hypothetical protein
VSGRRRSDSERFARIPDSLLQSPAVTSLSHAAFRVLVILAMGARPPGIVKDKDPGRNGVQAITDSHACKYGLNSRATVYRALDELLERHLIVKTRDGHKSKSHFALYAVEWLPITHRDGEVLGQAEAAPMQYLEWKDPERKRQQKCRPLTGHDAVEMPSCERTQSRPVNGRDASVCRPLMRLI